MDEIYLLKNGSLYNIKENSALRMLNPVDVGDVVNSGGKFQLIIDDSYFFYVYVGKLSVNHKKVRSMIGNYIQSMFPQELFADFTIYNNKGVYVAMLFRKELKEYIKDNVELFRKARRLTTMFCELFQRYDTFLFTDGVRVYERREDSVELLSSTPEGTLTAGEVIYDMLPLGADIPLPEVRRSRESLNKNQMLIAAVAICYVLFLLSGIVQNMAESKRLAGYEKQLSDLYVKAGVSDNPDPYGILLSRAERRQFAPFRALDVIKALGSGVIPEISLESMNLNERTMRIEGFAKDFAEMEKLKTSLESALRKQITVEDSRQAGDRIRFTIRYEI
jgi:hypothetical protein